MKRRTNRMKLKENVIGYAFISPLLLGIGVLTFFSLGFSLYISFTDWQLIGSLDDVKFVGFANFAKAFHDPYFWVSLRNNLWFLMVVPIQTLLALLLAVALHKLQFLGKLLRIVFFLPHITNMVAILIVWNLLFNPMKGPVNAFLKWVGVSKPPLWQMDPLWSKPTLALFGIWTMVGYFTLIYLAALTGVSKELYEAAEIDGARGVQKFTRITLPLVSPTTFFIVMISVISSFQQWTNVQVFTDGGPGSSTYVLGYFVYKYGFGYYQMGYASAVAWILAIIILTITMIQWKIQKHWVHYN